MFWKTMLSLALAAALLSGCQKTRITEAESEPEEEPIVITKWTDKTELFVEFPVLVVGEEIPFAAHLTDLETFQPVSSDVVVTTLTGQDGHTITARTPTPLIPGIYRPMITPDKSGLYRLTVRRTDPKDESRMDVVDAGEFFVFENRDDIPGFPRHGSHGEIPFLKEQQWRIDFATAIVQKHTLNATLKLHAEVEPTAEGRVEIAAPIGGRILPSEKGLPAPGQKVIAGETLAMILPLHASARSRDDLQFAVRSAQAELKASQKELDRIRRLYQDQIVPKRRLEEAEKNTAILKARLAKARSRISLLDVNQETVGKGTSPQSVERFPLRSPISGTITRINMTPGAQIEAGAPLFTIIDLDSVWIEARLFEVDIPKIGSVEHAHFSAASLAAPINLRAPDSRLIAVGQVIDPVHRSVPLIMQVHNAQGQLRIGTHGHLAVPTGETIHDLAIPKSAVVDDRGVPVAFIHADGESFERRELILGIQDEGYIQVKSGLKAGERIVTKSAYRVYLASLSTQLPQHGHAH
ncbi:MAG: efflux RND transporter periplasmic adaptor subunit [Nitrospiria bacterium]